MLKLAGCILVICGCAGFADSICREAVERLSLLKEIKRIYEDMQYYIAYRKEVITEVLYQLSQSREGYFTASFYTIYQKTREGKEPFPTVWKQYMKGVLERSPLKKKEYFLLMELPGCIGFLEEHAQAKAFDRLIRECELRIKEQEKEQRDKNRIVMGVGVTAGILLSILLL